MSAGAATILVVDDEPQIRRFLRLGLEGHGYAVAEAASAEAALRTAVAQQPDLVVLDLGLPDREGFEVLRTLREWSRVPVFVLSVRNREGEKVRAFELGADDYVVKPFSVRELTLRVGAILRRGTTEVASDALVEFGILKMDREAHRVWIAGEELELTALEFKLLSLLYDRRDRVQTRSVLLDVVWGISADVTTRTVDTHVKRLREKLGDARDYIETVRGVGYRFVGDLGQVSSGESG